MHAHHCNLLNPVRRCSCSSGVGQGTQPERGGLGLSKEGLKGVEEQRRRGKEGLKLLLLFVKVKVLSLSTFRIIIFCGFCFLFSAWWGLGGAESTRNVQINQIQKAKPLIAVQRKRYWSCICMRIYTLWLAILPYSHILKQMSHVLLIEPTLWVR